MLNSFSLQPPPLLPKQLCALVNLKYKRAKYCGIALVFKFWHWKELLLKQRLDFLDKVGKRLSTLNQSLSSSILILHCKMYTIPIPLPSGEIFRKRVDFPAIFEKETLNIKLTSSGYMTVEGLHTDRSVVYYCLVLIHTDRSLVYCCLVLILNCLVFFTQCYCPVSSV